MADEEEIAVTIEGETPGGDDVVVHQDDAVAELKKQYQALEADNKKRKDAEEAASRRAADADRRAAEASARASAAETRVAESEGGAIESGIAAANSLAAQAKADYKAALEKGDFDAAAEAQERLADAVADRKRLNEAKVDLEARKSSPRTEDTSVRISGDPFEQHLTKFTPRTADWMRGHRDWVTDPRKSAKLTGAHHMAIGDGLTPDTDEYFEHVEKTLGLREQPPARSGNGSGNGQGRQQQRRGAPPVAPVNGSAGGHSSGAGENRGSNQVYLTRREAAAANDGTHVWNPGNRHPKTGEPIQHNDPLVGKPIGNHEMARRKLYGERQGLYDKNNIEA